MSDGRTVWLALDAGWWRREGVVELLDEVGPVGPCVVLWLACEAKAQDDGGHVVTGYRSIARAIGEDLVTVSHAVSRAVTAGLLDDFEERGKKFAVRISGWKAEQERALGAARKARQRAREEAEAGDSPANSPSLGNGTERDTPGHVTPGPKMSPTGQDRTGQNKDSLTESHVRTEVRELSDRLASLIAQRDPAAKVAPESKAWLDAIRLLIDRDGRTAEQVAYVIDWCQADEFWRSNILSAPKLRERFTQLVAQIQRDRPSGQRSSQSDYLDELAVMAREADEMEAA